ncbi:PREDICTED: zinc finger protein RFP-like [Gekko japonicus]|uniref:Zinc finger protein RFP-like n=1 Tax=Gekko japonicus TaxID=146911 RepID=A0ABM1LBX8_GEKJA|nr:PREDICTED: zinc finger protein RFP-like [Gekko japonicus]
MASEEAATRLQEELSCSICLECFRDPVSIHCGHNFCRACITNYWRIGKKKTFSCPRCRETSRKKTLKPNLELKNIAEIAPKLQVAKAAGEMTCKRHQEPLKLFCKDDQMLICVVCDKSKEHQNHAVLPLEEAAQDYQKQIQDQLKCLWHDKEQLLAFKAIGSANHKESLRKITSEMQKAESVFEQAHEFLSEQKQFLLAQWESLKTAAEKQQQEHTNKLSENISCLDSLIIEAEGRCQRPTNEFLQDVKSTLVRLKKRKFQDSMETSSGLEESLNSLIRKNVVVKEILQKIKDTLPSEVEKGRTKSPAALEAAKGAPSFGVAGSPAMKRKVVRHVVVPVRNMNAQRYQMAAASSTSSSDGSLGSKMSFPRPSVPDKMASMGDGKSAELLTEGDWEGIQGPKSAGGHLKVLYLSRGGGGLNLGIKLPALDWALLVPVQKEASCPICLGYFQDPVTMPCGHNFCRTCIAQCWGELEGNVSCPQCGENSPLSSSADNQHLARIADSVRCLHRETSRVLEERRMCEGHQEPVTVFCKDDKIPICLVCAISKEHRHHTVIPTEDAVQDYKEKLGNEGKRVVSEFEHLHQFLEDQEQLLLARLEQLENELIKEKKTITSKLSEEISNLSDLISEIEEKCKQPMNEFLQDIKNILNRCENQKIQQPVEHSLDLERRLNAFSEETMHLEDFQRKFKDGLSSELESTPLLKHALGIPKARTRLFDLPFAEVAKRTGRRVNVTLDPGTANPFLILSADQKSVRLGDVWQDVCDNPERFDTYPCVLGCEGFMSGRHYWEVEVGSGRYWAVGFAKESVRRKGEIIPSPEEQIWALKQYGDYFEALTYPVTTLSLSSWPRRIQVFLDYEEDRVAFFDADTAALIYVFSPATFSQERILPWLWVWPGTELRLYQ